MPYNNAIFVDSKAKWPKVEHWAIIKFNVVDIPGDERSRTHPGHGYGAHSVNTVSYTAYTKRDDWIAAIQSLESVSSRSYVAVFVGKPAEVELKVNIKE